MTRRWWERGVLYQVYPRSYQDTNRDGIGDLPGITRRLDHLAWLGVDGIWLNPTMPSPNRDWGYDVAAYDDVAPDLGTLGDLDRLVEEAGRRDICVLLDLVPNHTSDRHPWFLDSRSSRDAAHRDWYVWADPRPDGGPPNNWISQFRGPAWTFDEGTGQYYLHNFLPEQPDLNWWHEGVRDAFDDILRFWFDRGVAGFRIDVAHAIVKDRELRDNLPLSPRDPERFRRKGQVPTYNMHRPEVHDVLRRWRSLADAHDPPAVLIGEVWALDHADLARYYGGSQDELNLAFDFPFAMAPFEAEALATTVEDTERELGDDAWPVWTASNHDIGRLASAWCGGDDRKVRCALAILLTLRGTPMLYAGDEIGLPDVEVPPPARRDLVGEAARVTGGGRDACRTPMPWTGDANGGFTDDDVQPWLPLGDTSRNVAAQREDRASVMSWCRDLIALRRRRSDLQIGRYERLPAPSGTWAWRRGDHTIVVVNLSDEPVKAEVGEVSILLATPDVAGDGVTVALGPWSAAICGR